MSSNIEGSNNHYIEKKHVYCHNCGKNGHIYKECNLPVISYGIILFYPYSKKKFVQSQTLKTKIIQQLILNTTTKETDEINNDTINNNHNYNESLLTEITSDMLKNINIPSSITDIFEKGETEKDNELRYLMILDRYTPDYVQLILGNYSFDDLNYLKTLISRLTYIEIEMILKFDIEYIFKKYWTFTKHKSSQYYKQFEHSKKMLNKLVNGYTNTNGDLIKFSNLVEEFSHLNTGWNEPDWGFPKGRRKRGKYESDLDCAIREFKEETGIDFTQYVLLKNVKPIIEEYYGSNGVLYRHIYHLAKAKTYLPVYLNPYNISQTSEIQKIGWYTHSQGIQMIRPYHKDKISIFNKVHNYLNNYNNYDYLTQDNRENKGNID